ncbi:MAG: hypothetical protein P4L44_08465 [Oryzomonas sp.]|uniref:hypothetical protein n=1 Tax=Oryzomonas sp. TaxID=2855186 RepID=UPI002845990E|nr:hypothetical protein [Oryzomonas sp.]MDR3579979.1 hypothetical protein [Oryzomonas sp.]
MKRYAMAAVTALMVSASFPVFAEEPASNAENAKDECVLAAKNCRDAVDSLQQSIAKLNREIARGNKVYSPEDLRRLNEKLNEANDLMSKMLSNP